MIKRIALLLTIAVVTISKHSQPQPRTPNQSGQVPVMQFDLPNPDPHMNTKQEEAQKKGAIHMDRTIFEETSFMVTTVPMDFYLKPESPQQIRITFDVFWKQNNVYLLANVQEKEEIIVKVTDRTQYQLAEESFFTTTGLKFEAVAKQKYTIKIFTKGKIPKLVFMRISETVKTPETAAKKSEMKVTEEKLFFALTKLESALADTKTGHILDQHISSYVLHQSTAYSHFQILESFIVVLISCVEVMFVTRLLKTDSIV